MLDQLAFQATSATELAPRTVELVAEVFPGVAAAATNAAETTLEQPAGIPPRLRGQQQRQSNPHEEADRDAGSDSNGGSTVSRNS